ncbi:DJ-1 family protein [Pseudomonas sp. FW306-02-F02-AA]|uniref:Dihydroxyacetone kinase n=1 Tax=Pseudomonas fluorescens TaxID=294 RepID=A0A0N9VUQ8_PSEFL|nr:MULTISPECIES: DJ-1 family glyoxalase III [Pseudomonas]ALI02130.1 dihydroxyacetone kinase [Pseudomonas fluorescens]PMZ01036.1 DJ-1 family protein [Pseudomonas sp. FW306-02-F02-AB]PMZ06479.1 DJ-1 family protein [Pseudomonas sp. FW306-02-H06C]PMZ13831.1 DJ-1 family protein [Pseudomonas sp. FW306-02-F02-AA]PMZ18304.1 DJ-1 family protein [Pseudomonas sp. FW306-02-F08-AA]
MTFRALITLAEGIDDLQAVTLIDVLRRAKVEVVVASIESRRMLTCARGTRLTADAMLIDVLAQPFDLVVLPGGAVGAQRLAAHQPLLQLVQDQSAAGRMFAGIAESPALALQAFGVLRQRRMTCLPAASHQLLGCTFVDQPVVIDGNCITAQGSSAALAFALVLVERLCGKAVRAAVAGELLA